MLASCKSDGNRPRTSRTYGRVKNVPMNGTCRRKVKITGKKSLHDKLGHEFDRYDKTRGVPEQVEKPEYLHEEPDERPFEEYKYDTSKETQGPPNFLFPSEEVKRLLHADDER